MEKILKGKVVADALSQVIIAQVKELKQNQISPKLVTLRVGQRPDDIAYEKAATKRMESLGIEIESIILKEEVDTNEVIKHLRKLDKAHSVHGILMFRPLPKHIDENKVIKEISPKKDVDCMNPLTMSELFEKKGKRPATAQSVIEIIKYYNIDLTGKEVCVIGRSNVIGKPLALLLMDLDATVTVCHSKTRVLKEVVNRADVVVSAMGRAKTIDKTYIKEGAIVIDVGINILDGQLCGDVDFDNVIPVVSHITPVPKGVGSVTTVILAQNLLKGI